MKAICKKLLSLLVVMAMVLSMVPFGGLSVFAAETNATTTETVTPGSASVTEDVQKHIDEVKANIQSLDPATVAAGTTCPMCGATDITWTTATQALGAKADGAAYHYYMAGEINVSNSAYNWAIVRGEKTTMCLLLDDAVLSGGGTIGAGGTDCTLNIMGTGTLTSTGANSEDYGLVKSNGTRSTVNLYGGTYIYTGAAYGKDGTVPQYGAVLVSGASAVANIYDGVAVGPETVTNTAPLYNVRITAGTVNMYGGTVRNGVTEAWGYSGNVSIASNGTFNLYGGTISGGTYVADHDDVVAASVGGNVLIGACTWNKDQGKAISTNAKFYMYGGTVTGGSVRNGGNGGGNICVMGASVCEITGGTVSNGTAYRDGGNIQAQGGTVTIGGTALIADGTAQYGGNLDVSGGTVTINDSATISGGVATINGGSIFIDAGKALTMNGGTVTGGKVKPTFTSTVGGGNVYVNATTEAGQATFTLKGGEISGGKAFYYEKTNADNTTTNQGGYGGNIHGQGNVVIEGGKVSGGWSQQHGGNISVSTGGSLTVSGGEISGGVAELQAGNIRSWQAPVTISGGYIHDGQANGKGSTNHNVWVQGGSATSGHSLTISGGTIDGDVLVGNGPLTLSGAPVITAGKSIGLQNRGDAANVSGLTEGASIVVTAKAGDVLSAACDNAAAVAACFTCADSALIVAAAADNTLVVQEKPVQVPEVGVFEPWNCGGMAYCPACGNTAAVAWTELDSSHAAGYIDGHYYLTEDITEASKGDKSAYIMPTSGKIACVNLNGHDLTVTDGCALFGANGTLNMIDTAKEQGTVSGGNTTSSGATIQLNGGKGTSKVNIYGGIYTKIADTSNAPIVAINDNGGTLNMYGGVIDGTGKTTNTYASCVNMRGSVGGQYSAQAIFNMYGGKILGGTSTGNGGAIRVAGGEDTATMSYCNAAVFNLYGGEIIGGTAQGGNGGVIYAWGNTVNIYGGTIRGGEAITNGGTLLIESKNNVDKEPVPATLNMSGGTIYGGTAGNQGGILRAYKATVSMSGKAVMYAGTANGASKTHGVWLVDSDMTMSGDAKVYGPEGAVSYANAISLAQYQVGSSLTLDGNATVKAVTGESRNCIQVSYSADYPNTLMISNDWTGEAYVTTYKEGGTGYARGETIDNILAVCGSLVEGVPTKGGSYEGKLYYGPQNNAQILGVEGDLVVGLVAIKAADGETWYSSNAEAVAAYKADGGFEAGSYILMGNEGEIVLDGDAYVDSRGYPVTVGGSGTLYAMDNANDDYDGYGTWTIISENVEVATDVENAVKDRRYIVIDMTDDSEGNRCVSAHRLEMGIQSITLRTSAAGLYYNAYYTCDKTLAAAISSYGVVVSVNDLPGADFQNTADDHFSVYEDFAAQYAALESGYTVAANSTSVFGIMKDTNSAADNAAHGEMDIYANAYIVIDGETVYVADEANAGQKAGVAYSLHDVMLAMDNEEFWNSLALGDQARVNEFYTQWNEQGGMADWTFENIALVQNG